MPEDYGRSLAQQMGHWGRKDPVMQRAAKTIADSITSSMPAELTDEQEACFLAAVVNELMGTLNRVATRMVAEAEQENA
ncbi:hypothetical protein [Streptomyces silvisoli]|uniref:Uncharacterized protein n=1 Tax=Streptomyces silvisoli TaxID=3034235 RepID=A0ABT5ZP03_9ACTN|nr:hypothetical protein [Streptomyces silvisoli]MDF3290738.1 hypothetical protein [Streptomyces silvisoli]